MEYHSFMDRKVMYKRLLLTVPFVLIGLLALVRPSHAGKKVYVGSNVPESRRVSIDTIKHTKWDAIVRKYVNGDGLVDYAGLKSSRTDLESLDRYIKLLSSADPSVSAKRESILAYWINAYNAVTVYGILREYPTTSIRNHTAKVVGYNIWHDLQLVAGGKGWSLDQMEHEILRKMNEPRIHFAIVCASIGCPRLLNEAYVPERLEAQLETNAKDFFSRPQNFRYAPASQRFYMSAILSWFGTDFGKDRAAQLGRIAAWLPTAEAQQAARQNAVSVSFLEYDWNLNEQKKNRRVAGR